MQCACYIAESNGGHPLRLNPCPDHERWAKAIREYEREVCSQKAREFASHYEQGSDGRNTFVILAEWIENRT